MKPVLLAVLAGYVAYATLMVALHARLIYPFLPDDHVLPGFDRVLLYETEGVPVFVQERKGTGPVVLYFMGNAGALALFAPAFADHVAADRHIVALEYRGGAGRPGVASERALKADALRAADYALQTGKPLIVQGFSLGTGLAIHVASQRLADRVVLSAPYDGLCRLMAARSFLPACLLPGVQKWQSLQVAHSIAAPLLVLHGSEDAIIPPDYSEAFSGLPNARRVLVDGAGHNDLSLFMEYRERIERFLGPTG